MKNGTVCHYNILQTNIFPKYKFTAEPHNGPNVTIL